MVGDFPAIFLSAGRSRRLLVVALPEDECRRVCWCWLAESTGRLFPPAMRVVHDPFRPIVSPNVLRPLAERGRGLRRQIFFRFLA